MMKQAKVLLSLTTTADKAASSSCCSPSSSSKLTWKHRVRHLYLQFFSPKITSVSPLLSTPVYRGHSGASISFSSKGQSFKSTDSLLPLTCSKQRYVKCKDSEKFTLPGFPPPFPLVGVGTRLFLCFVISLLFATIYCCHQLMFLVHDLKQTQSQLDLLRDC